MKYHPRSSRANSCILTHIDLLIEVQNKGSVKEFIILEVAWVWVSGNINFIAGNFSLFLLCVQKFSALSTKPTLCFAILLNKAPYDAEGGPDGPPFGFFGFRRLSAAPSALQSLFCSQFSFNFLWLCSIGLILFIWNYTYTNLCKCIFGHWAVYGLSWFHSHYHFLKIVDLAIRSGHLTG